MEYLGRLGLVPRKSRKDREKSPQKKRCGEDSRALKTDFTRAIESGLPSKEVADYLRPSSTILDIARRPISNPTMTPPPTELSARLSSASALQDDLDYFAYMRHVRAQARAREALFGAPGGRHAWKTLIFWKRRRTAPTRTVSLGPGLPSVGAASTPHRTGWMTPNRKASLRRHHQVSGCDSSGCRSPGPLYCCGDDFDSTMSIRTWYEPMLRRGKLVSLWDEEVCNRSPYVPLGGRRASHIASSPGPLYLV